MQVPARKFFWRRQAAGATADRGDTPPTPFPMHFRHRARVDHPNSSGAHTAKCLTRFVLPTMRLVKNTVAFAYVVLLREAVLFFDQALTRRKLFLLDKKTSFVYPPFYYRVKLLRRKRTPQGSPLPRSTEAERSWKNQYSTIGLHEVSVEFQTNLQK